jgi:hypothetical protein
MPALAVTDMTAPQSIEFDGNGLVPAAWQREQPDLAYFVFNPAICPCPGGWVMVYRVVAPRYATNRIAACRLDASLKIVAGSVVPLSDTLIGVNQGIGDPRLVQHGERTYLLYCRFDPVSHLFLAELDLDALSAKGDSRFLALPARQLHERNWMLFPHDGDLLAVYTISPHVVLRLDLAGRAEVSCERVFTTHWNAGAYARRYGELRGGTSPARVGDAYYAFFHSSRFTGWAHPLLRRVRRRLGGQAPGIGQARSDGLSTSNAVHTLHRLYAWLCVRLRYTGGFYGFSARPPFAPTCLAVQPVLVPEDECPALRADRLRPAARQVVFPTGAALTENQQWLVSYGVHDERCKIRGLDHSALLRRCTDVQTERAHDPH